jgi:hypothetical protein
MTGSHQALKKEIFEVKSSRDPVTGTIGTSMGYNLSAAAQKTVLYYKRRRTGEEFFLTADVYQLEGQPLYLILFCPLCQNTLRVSEDNKSMQYEPEIAPKFPGFRAEEILSSINAPSLGGLLSVEPFGCTWEAEPELRRTHFSVCTWRVSITNNVVRDA